MNHKLMSALLAVVFIIALQGTPLEATDPGPAGARLHVGSSPDGGSVIRIPANWRERYPFSDRFGLRTADSSTKHGKTSAHIIDLKATRFATDNLVQQGTGGREFLAPDASSFRPSLVRGPFANDDRDLFIVQAPDPAAQKRLRAWLESSQFTILDFIPDLAYLVRLDKKGWDLLRFSPDVYWVGLFQPAWRIPGKLDYIIELDPGRRLKLRANFDGFRYLEEDAVLKQLEAVEGLTILRIEPTGRGFIALLEGRVDAAHLLAALPGCLWVERYIDFQLDNNIARASSAITTGRGSQAGPIMDVEDVWARGIRGEGQIASASDTGLSTGNLATLHWDFGQQGSTPNPMRVVKGYALGRATWNDDQDTGGGHGTHTSGSIVGNGVRSGSDPSTNTFPSSSFAGSAPKAQFVFQSVMDIGGGLGGIPLDLNNLFSPPYADGARVHSNSWGAPVGGDYNTDSQNVDEFVWNNNDMVITFSAGNSGVDLSPTNGIIDTDNIGSPGTAKNCITVGASEDYRPGFIYEYPAGDCTGNGWEQQAWGWFNGTNFSVAPIYADLMADNASGMGAFSSRGPTDDGRIKPDIVAPGIAIISTRTDVNQAYDQWGVCSIPAAQQAYYMTMGGTSMSTPLTAGTAVLVRQYYVDGWHANGSLITNGSAVPADGFQPSAALVKATLINGAWDMAPGQFDVAYNEIPPGWDAPRDLPNNAEGYGRVDLEHSLFPGSGWGDDTDRVMAVHDVSPGLQTGQSDHFTFDVTSNANPLIATLVWTDPYGATSAGTELVNDLDLTVTAPDGTTVYYPNRLDYTGGTADRKNNVEQVKVTSPVAGTWSIDIAGFNVPGNAQTGSTTEPYALVISGISKPCSAAPPTGLSASASPSDDNAIQLTWTAASGATEYRVYRSTVSGSGYAQVATVTEPTTSYLDTGVHGGVTYYYVVTTYDGSLACESVYSSEASATPTGPCGLAPTFTGVASAISNGDCANDLSWPAASTICSGPVTYSVYRSTTSGFTPSGSNRIAIGLSGTAYTDAEGLSGGTTYSYIVRATDESNGQEDTNTVEQSSAPYGAPVPTTLYGTENFDSYADGNGAGWTMAYFSGSTGDWRGVRTCPPAHSGSKIFRYGGNTCTTDYGNNNHTVAYPPSISVPAGSQNTRLTFYHRWFFETSYDGAYLRVSLDGSNWYLVDGSAISQGGYNDSSGLYPWWSGNNSSSFTFTEVDLDGVCDAITGSSGGCQNLTIYVGFVVFADISINYDGWYIDDVTVTADVPTLCDSTPSDVAYLTARSTSEEVMLEWVNPSGSYGSTLICRDTAGYPADPTACATEVIDKVGTAGVYDTYIDDSVADETKYYYTAFVDNGSGVYSGGVNSWAYPFDTAGKVKWAYSSAASSLAPTGVWPGAIGVGGAWAVSNDRMLHGMNPTAAGGAWPRTPPYSWVPMAMNGPAQARPPIVPTAAVSGASQVIFLGSEDGHAYAANAHTGTALWQSPVPLANILMASPSGMFTDFGGSWNLLFIGSRDATADNTMYALDPADGSVKYQFNYGGGANGIGIISSAATVDYTNNRIYFASRSRAGGSSDTLWCLSFDGSSFSRLWSVALGDIDGAPVLYEGRLYVGNNIGTVYAVNPDTGVPYWTYAASGNGPVKGFVMPQFVPTLPRRVYFSTTSRVWSITDNGGSASFGWSVTTVPGPSIPLAPIGEDVLYAGSSDGSLYQLNAADGEVQTSVVLGDGAATIGSPARDGVNNMAYVGSESGAVYGVALPLQ